MSEQAACHISALLLAAGKGERMARLKQLLPLGDSSMLETSLRNLERSRVREIVVVLGFAAERIMPLLRDKPNVKVVVNARFEEGMSSSIRCGLGAIAPEGEGVLVALADQPFIPPEVIDLLIDAFVQFKKGIVVPVYRGQRGHPVILSLGKYRGDLLTLVGDVGARELLAAHPEDVLEVEVSSWGAVVDIDFWDDYQKIQREGQ